MLLSSHSKCVEVIATTPRLSKTEEPSRDCLSRCFFYVTCLHFMHGPGEHVKSHRPKSLPANHQGFCFLKLSARGTVQYQKCKLDILCCFQLKGGTRFTAFYQPSAVSCPLHCTVLLEAFCLAGGFPQLLESISHAWYLRLCSVWCTLKEILAILVLRLLVLPIDFKWQ
jgi:hypothetical protein